MKKLLIAVTMGLATSLAAQGQSSERDAASEWFWKVRDQAHDAVMPLTLPDVAVAYRASDDMRINVPERYFAIQYIRFGFGFAPDALKATVMSPIGNSVHEQLIYFRVKDRNASLADLISRLTLRRETIDVDSCKPILIQMDQLPHVRVSIPSRDIISLDGPRHQFVLNFSPFQMTATMDDDDEPLVRWASRTYDALLKCLPPSLSARVARSYGGQARLR